jgi:hypothetical protein
MGYTTDFTGSFSLNKKLDFETHEYLNRFSESRRMKRKLEGYGIDGEFYLGSGDSGQDHEDNIVNYNEPPLTQPGLWCNWKPNDCGTAIEWNGAEKFYCYTLWLKYIITNFLAPKGYVLNGRVAYQGENEEDFGVIIVENNKIYVTEGVTHKDYGPPKEI